ncbi:MAG: cadherin-like domain-containing protein [Psychrobium sp.]|nr:cadherin-like domain-containing protein [Psychrobium sp.]
MKKNIVLTTLSLALLSACGGSSSNDLPLFSQATLSLSVAEDTVLSQKITATDKNGDDITYSLANAASNGQVMIDAKTGALTYTPNPNFNGDDSFSVAASDAKGRTTQQISVAVTAVNDKPTIEMNNVLLSGGEVKQGMVKATDVDGDALIYSIELTPSNGTLTINKDTGAITYTVTQLQETKDSFTLGVTDGNGDVITKSITISASIASNIDRAYYYYASDQSRLQQAQSITDAQKDDLVKSNVYSSLARGYAMAGFSHKVEKLLTPESILDQETLARAMINAASANIHLGNHVIAKDYLVQAQNLYNEVLATNGIATLDASLLLYIGELYHAMGDLQAQAQTYSLLDLLMNTLPEGTESQRLFFGYDRAVKAAVKQWQQSGLEVDRLRAKSLAQRSLRLIPKIGYSTNRDGVTYSTTTLIGYEYLIKQFYQLNEIKLAKQTLANALALYGYVDYDDDYSVVADQYADNTKDEFVWVSPDFAALYITLYPNAESAPLVDIAKGSAWFDYVKASIISDADEARMLAQVTASTTDEKALKIAQAVKNDDDLRQYFSDIISFNAASPGAAVRLVEQKRYSAAKLLLDEGLALIQSAEYFSENRSSYTFISGDAGCNRIARLYQTLDNAMADAGYLAHAKSSAKICHDLVVKHYSEEMVDSDGTILSSNFENVQAAAETANLLAELNMTTELTALLEVANQSLAQATDNSVGDNIQLLSQLGRELSEGGQFALSQPYYDRAIAKILTLEKSATAAEQGNAARYFFNGTRNNSNYQQLLLQIDQQQLSISNAAQVKATAVSHISNLFEQVMTLLADRSDIIKNEEYPNFARLFIQLGNIDRASELANDAALGDVEKASIEVSIAKQLATQDDFPSTIIASVDTDGDGMPNFFAPFATPEMIKATGLVLDPDSDNDKVNDEDDAFPLDASRQ